MFVRGDGLSEEGVGVMLLLASGEERCPSPDAPSGSGDQRQVHRELSHLHDLRTGRRKT